MARLIGGFRCLFSFDANNIVMSVSVGIIGVSGYGGGEALRICASHPQMDVVYVGGESSAGTKLKERFPGIRSNLADLTIEKFDAGKLPKLDLLIASLPTGQSKQALANLPAEMRVVDIGGDHRFVDGWVYGLADAWPEKIKNARRVANPGCYPAASLGALAPLVAGKLIDSSNIIIDAKSGVSGAGRGSGDSKFGYADLNEDVYPYGLLKHAHMPEIITAIGELGKKDAAGLVFTPHLVPMTRGIIATCYARGQVSTEQCLEAARKFYSGRPFVRVVDTPAHSKWATGSNLLFASYAADPARNLVIAIGAIDNLGKGAAGQAVQNANLMFGFDETTGLEATGLWP